MALIHENSFTRTRTDEERQDDKTVVISLRLNKEEITRFEDAGRLLQQERPSSIVKQLAELGLLSLQHEETRAAMRLVFKNTSRNHRLGIMEAMPKIKRM